MTKWGHNVMRSYYSLLYYLCIVSYEAIIIVHSTTADDILLNGSNVFRFLL